MEALRSWRPTIPTTAEPGLPNSRKEIPMSARTTTSAARIRLHTVQAPERLGGETRPYEYPHLYQIQAGDWRISYAVEQNRLAILVLEVLNADGTVVQDPVRETLDSQDEDQAPGLARGQPEPRSAAGGPGPEGEDPAPGPGGGSRPRMAQGERATPRRVRLSGSKTQVAAPRRAARRAQGFCAATAANARVGSAGHRTRQKAKSRLSIRPRCDPREHEGRTDILASARCRRPPADGRRKRSAPVQMAAL